MEENITKPNTFLNLPHISGNIKAAAFLNFSSANLELLKLSFLQYFLYCYELKILTLCVSACI